MDGKALAERIRAELKDEVGAGAATSGWRPCWSATTPPPRSTSAQAQGRGEVGIEGRDVRLPRTRRRKRCCAPSSELNGDDAIDGMLVQLPLPRHLDEAAIIAGDRPGEGRRRPAPGECRPALPGPARGTSRRRRSGSCGCSRSTTSSSEGARAVVVGRSGIVGKPVALLSSGANATVTICHSRTPDLGRGHARGRRARRRGRRTGLIGRGKVKDGSHGRGRRDEPQRRGSFRRRRPLRGRRRRPPDAGPGRRRPDDDRAAFGEHRAGPRFRSGEVAFPF